LSFFQSNGRKRQRVFDNAIEEFGSVNELLLGLQVWQENLTERTGLIFCE